MMGRRLPVKSGDEFDATTRWKNSCKKMGRVGVRARLKRQIRRRERRGDMPCMCGDTSCSSCGPAQGFNPAEDIVFDYLCDILKDSGIEGLDEIEVANLLVERLGREAGVIDALYNAAIRWMSSDEYQKQAREDIETIAW